MSQTAFIPASQVKRHLEEVRKRSKKVFGDLGFLKEKMKPGMDKLSKEEVDAGLARIQRADTFAESLKQARAHAAVVSDALASASACKKGCSHCCNIPVSITELEALEIGKSLGVEVSEPRPGRFYTMAQMGDNETMTKAARIGQKRYTGVPCVFLDAKERSCSIYDERPIPCRLQFNMDDDDLLCKLVEGHSPRVPYLDLRDVELTMIGRLAMEPGQLENVRLADLRDWFPNGLKNKRLKEEK